MSRTGTMGDGGARTMRLSGEVQAGEAAHWTPEQLLLRYQAADGQRSLQISHYLGGGAVINGSHRCKRPRQRSNAKQAFGGRTPVCWHLPAAEPALASQVAPDWPDLVAVLTRPLQLSFRLRAEVGLGALAIWCGRPAISDQLRASDR